MSEGPLLDGSHGPSVEGIRAAAITTLESAATELRAQLAAVAELIDPFPSFPGAVFAYGIEVEPRGGGDPELGCVILGNDGALYELEIGLADAQPQQAVADASTERHEELRPLDASPEVFVLYAFAAIEAAAAYLDAQGAASDAGGT